MLVERVLAAVAAFLLLLVVATQGAPIGASASAMAAPQMHAARCTFSDRPHIILPLYGYREYADVSAVTAGYPAVGIVVVGVSNGPGSSYDAYHGDAIHALAASGICVVGYVSTRHGARPLAAVQADIATWYALYGGQGLRGIWLDEGAISATMLGYYQALYATIKSYNGFDVVNPGSYPDRRLMSAADLTIVNERDQQSFISIAPPAWALNASPSTMGAYILAVSDIAHMRSDLSLARYRHVGWVFLTDRALSQQPYQSLPVFWPQEIDAVASGQ
jgi:hypothetical protein